MYIVSVFLLSQKVPRGTTLPYRSTHKLSAGMVVLVPFRSADVYALVLSCVSAREQRSTIRSLDFSLKTVTRVVGHHAFFTHTFLSALDEFGSLQLVETSTLVDALWTGISTGVIKEEPQEPSNRTTPLARVYSTKTTAAYLPTLLEILQTQRKSGERIGVITATGEQAAVFGKLLSSYDPLVIKNADQFTKQESSQGNASLVITPIAYASIITPCDSCILIDPLSFEYNTITDPVCERSWLFWSWCICMGVPVSVVGPRVPWYLESHASNDYQRTPPQILVLPDAPKPTIPEKKKVFEIPMQIDVALKRYVSAVDAIIGTRHTGLYACTIRATSIARLIRCVSCGNIPKCPTCTKTLSVEQSPDRGRVLSCSLCHHHEAIADTCTSCGGLMDVWSPGTQSVTAALQAAFPLASVQEITKDATGDKRVRHKAYAAAVKNKNNQLQILVGSVALAEHIDDSCDAVLCSDAAFVNPAQPYALENSVHLLEVLAMKTSGSVYVTRQTLNDLFGAGVSPAQSYHALFAQEMQLRKQFGIGGMITPQTTLPPSIVTQFEGK